MAPKCSVASTASPWCIKVFALLHLKQHETYVVEGSWKSDIEENLVQKLPAHTCKVDWIGGSLGSHPSGFANDHWDHALSMRVRKETKKKNLVWIWIVPCTSQWQPGDENRFMRPGYAWLSMVWFLFLMFFWGKLCKNKQRQRVACKWCPPCQMSVCSWP